MIRLFNFVSFYFFLTNPTAAATLLSPNKKNGCKIWLLSYMDIIYPHEVGK